MSKKTLIGYYVYIPEKWWNTDIKDAKSSLLKVKNKKTAIKILRKYNTPDSYYIKWSKTKSGKRKGKVMDYIYD